MPSLSSHDLQILRRVCARCQIPAQTQQARCAFQRFQTGTTASRGTTFDASTRIAPITIRTFKTRPSSSSSSSFSPSEQSNPTTSPKTHYDLFPQTLSKGPPPTGPFHINPQTLRREYLSLQAKTHPDLAPSEKKSSAEAASAALNDAYRTLLNPLLRAQYLLSLRGVDVATDERLQVEEPGLLMVVLEASEEIDEARTEEDLKGPKWANYERIKETEEALDKAFAVDDMEAAKREAVKMRYWVNIQDSLDNWEKGVPTVLLH